MDSGARLKITCEEFSKKLNEFLRKDPANSGMVFHHDKDGFELLAPALTEAGRMALSKAIFDAVSERYAISGE